MDFPQYRKYKNESSWFKIESYSRAVEIKVLGNTPFVYKITADTMPDRNLIYDLIHAYEIFAVQISKTDFEEFIKKYPDIMDQC